MPPGSLAVAASDASTLLRGQKPCGDGVVHRQPVHELCYGLCDPVSVTVVG
jgi:hypothetical protein